MNWRISTLTNITLPPHLRAKAIEEIQEHLAKAYRTVNSLAPAPDADCLNQAANLWLDQLLNELVARQIIPDFDAVRNTQMQQVLLFEYLGNREKLQIERIKAHGICEATAILISDGLRHFSINA
jgi:hypothetical protein